MLIFPIADWAEDMKALTDGRWDVEVHYGAVLAPAKEGIDGLKAGMFEAVLYTSMYGPGKLPLSTVMQLPFFGPQGIEQTGQWFMEVVKHPAIQKEMDQWNAEILFAAPVANYEYMGQKPVMKAEDFNGLRIRIDPVSGKPLEDYGAVITNLPGPEIYTALERGMLDGVIWVWTYTFGSYKLYELSQYATTGINLKKTDMFLYVNKDAWKNLPDEWKKLANFSSAKYFKRYDQYNVAANAKWLPTFAKAGIEVSVFPTEERAKLVAKAEASYEKWIEEMEGKGLPGREVFEWAKAKRDEIAAKAEAAKK